MKKPAKLKKSVSESTTDNRTYKIASRRFKGPGHMMCDRCPPRKGCNHPRNWK